jgi:hypothetical protein
MIVVGRLYGVRRRDAVQSFVEFDVRASLNIAD